MEVQGFGGAVQILLHLIDGMDDHLDGFALDRWHEAMAEGFDDPLRADACAFLPGDHGMVEALIVWSGRGVHRVEDLLGPRQEVGTCVVQEVVDLMLVRPQPIKDRIPEHVASLSWPSPDSVPTAFSKKGHDPLSDFFPDLPDTGHWLALRVLQGPVPTLEPRNHGALISASHGDERVGALRQIAGEQSGLRPRKVDASFLHGLQDFRMDLGAWVRACRDSPGLQWVGQGVKEGRSHLGPASIVDAREDHCLHADS